MVLGRERGGKKIRNSTMGLASWIKASLGRGLDLLFPDLTARQPSGHNSY